MTNQWKDPVEKKCLKCGNVMNYQEGISKKNNKPYKMYKCINKECGEVEWIRSRGPQNAPGQAIAAEHDQGEKILNALRLIYIEISEIKKSLEELKEYVGKMR